MCLEKFSIKKLEKYLKNQQNPSILEIEDKIKQSYFGLIEGFDPLQKNSITKKAYTGNNAIFLYLVHKTLGWSNEWAGYNQWTNLKRNVKSGEKGVRIAIPTPKKIEKDNGETDEILYFKSVTVFNFHQTEEL